MTILPVQPDTIPATLTAEARWLLWNLEPNADGKLTKVPYQARRPTAKADSTDQATWADFLTTLRAYQEGQAHGIGFVLGAGFFGFDADDCRDPDTGAIVPEVFELFADLKTYTEISPRRCGLKGIARGTKPGTKCTTKLHNHYKLELYDHDRFFCITGHPLADFPLTIEDRPREVAELYARVFPPNGNGNGPSAKNPHRSDRNFSSVDLDDAALIAKATAASNGWKFSTLWAGDTSRQGGDDSAADLALCNLLAFWTGCDASRMDDLFRRSGLYREKWDSRRGTETYGSQTIAKAIADCRDVYRGPTRPPDHHQGDREAADQHEADDPDAADHHDDGGQGVQLRDFHAYMPMHSYIFAPSREVWPASSVNARLRPVPLLQADGTPKRDDEGEPVFLKPSTWLDQHQPVEQMTWIPGRPMVIRDQLVADGGWIARPGCSCFNLYRPPPRTRGDARKASPWLEHVAYVFPDDHDHLIAWLAHRVQRPHEKINHALVLGGLQGIGKDTILEPIKAVIGAWNFVEVSPTALLGRFNGFAKAVILRISEARDLGEVDRYGFYDRLKIYTAAPPDVLRVDEKNLREYVVWNVCGVVITTNYRDGMYLPADDRRHYVCWSDRTRQEFASDYWTTLYRWYATGGTQHVAAYLARYDLARFNPKAPPPQTEAFWSVVDANRAPEDAELADALDQLGNPPAVTLAQLTACQTISVSFADWLRDRKHAREIPHRFADADYVPVRNPGAKDGLWSVAGRRQVIYVLRTLSPRDRLKAAASLVQGGQIG